MISRCRTWLPGASRIMAAVMAVASLAVATACASDTAADWGRPYGEELLAEGGQFDQWCMSLPESLPDDPFLQDVWADFIRVYDGGCRIEGGGYDSDTNRIASGRSIDIHVERVSPGSYMRSPSEQFDDAIAEGSIPLLGLGSEAALVAPGKVRNQPYIGASDDPVGGLELVIADGNLFMSFEATSSLAVDGGPDFRTESLAATASSLVDIAESFLAEVGAENQTLDPASTDSGQTAPALPHLCATLDIDGLAVVNNDRFVANDSSATGRCHWGDETSDLWLFAESVDPLADAGMTGEELAAWFTWYLAPTTGDVLDLGDEAYIAEFDPLMEESMTLEAPASDFAIRIGNVILQGRYQNDAWDTRAAAESYAATIADQFQALAEGP